MHSSKSSLPSSAKPYEDCSSHSFTEAKSGATLHLPKSNCPLPQTPVRITECSESYHPRSRCAQFMMAIRDMSEDRDNYSSEVTSLRVALDPAAKMQPANLSTRPSPPKPLENSWCALILYAHPAVLLSICTSPYHFPDLLPPRDAQTAWKWYFSVPSFPYSSLRF